ncbi:hypothetical protein F0344_15385 [Streptomyces finlayi]|uniref:Uncharacterized protein n=1 Tax=Streptomyces finlayi TaxID=67296 RepID=A0A7G7BKG6_9ACTN|nr:hypothetical protein [Streptomyces finlayi]QNE75831.1 hypothetical protein F0344_15385 [Streptomyces finlayi]
MTYARDEETAVDPATWADRRLFGMIVAAGTATEKARTIQRARGSEIRRR